MGTVHVSNGDRSTEATFHKTLPHNEFGEVRPSPGAFNNACTALVNILRPETMQKTAVCVRKTTLFCVQRFDIMQGCANSLMRLVTCFWYRSSYLHLNTDKIISEPD